MADADQQTDRTTTKRATAKRTTTKGAAPKRTPADRTTPDRPKKVPGGLQVAREGARQLQQLTGNEVEGITGMHRTDDGWRVQVDVLELRRVPNTTDVLATYDVDVDADGDLIGYHRRHRYVRGEVGER
jgi:hypothetical protein